MKRKILSVLNRLILMPAFYAGLIVFACGFARALPKNVTVNGVSVGGKTYAQAAEAVRGEIAARLKEKSLTVYGRDRKYVFAYPEIGFKDNLQNLLKSVKKDGSYTADVSFYLKGLNEIAAYICDGESVPKVEPYAIFNTAGEPFSYYGGADGIKADKAELISDIRASLENGFTDVKVKFTEIPREESLDAVKYNTRRLSSYTTYFDGDNAARSHNIRLAAKLINGTVINGGGKFSFNDTVGARTAQRGFRSAKIIENGEFVEGLGGGVCQVSTTLFNAALLSGCGITEFHAHSLAVGYVPPSFDAMVSGTYYDLKFENKTDYPLYIRARTGANYVKFEIYGRGDGASYEFASRVTENISPPEEYTSDPTLVKEGKDGLTSEGYLTVTRNGVKKTTLYRRDKYAPVKRIVLETAEEE